MRLSYDLLWRTISQLVISKACKEMVPLSSLQVHRAQCPMRVAPCLNRLPNSKSCPVDTCSAPPNSSSHREANVTLRAKVNRLLIRCTGASLGCSWDGPLRNEPAHTKEVCIILTNFCCVQSFLSVALHFPLLGSVYSNHLHVHMRCVSFLRAPIVHHISTCDL